MCLVADRNEALPEEFSDSDTTASISAVYKISDAVRVYARYGQGFRAPPANAVNAGFENLRGGYKVISNPDLQSETSTGTEVGLRFSGDGIYLDATVFRTTTKTLSKRTLLHRYSLPLVALISMVYIYVGKPRRSIDKRL